MKIILISLFLIALPGLRAQSVLFGKQNIPIQIPEVQELVYVIYIISESGAKDSLRIERKSEYYLNVLRKFDYNKDYAFVNKMGDLIKLNYNKVIMDACNYYFDEQGNIQKKVGVKNLSWGRKDYIKPHIKKLEKFAKTTGFRGFYKENTLYYDKMFGLLSEHTQLEKQKKWLEDRSDFKYENFIVFISPLNGGWHSTNRFSINEKKYFAIFVSVPYNEIDIKKIKKIYEERKVFTEINHNYVNPVSDKKKFLKGINKVFGNRKKWTNGGFTNGYPNAYSVFNEYMTWSLFALYIYDNYPEEIFVKSKEKVEDIMVNYRGFNRFKGFNDKILELYLKQNKKTIKALYNPILEWCEKE